MSESTQLFLVVLIIAGLFLLWGYVGYKISKGMDRSFMVCAIVGMSFFGTQCTLQVIVNLIKAYGV